MRASATPRRHRLARRYACTLNLPVAASDGLIGNAAVCWTQRRIAGPILVLVVWALVGIALALALGGRIMNPADTEAEAAAGAAV